MAPDYTSFKAGESHYHKCYCTCGCEILVYRETKHDQPRCYKCKKLNIHGTKVK